MSNGHTAPCTHTGWSWGYWTLELCWLQGNPEELWPGADSQRHQPDICTGMCACWCVCVCVCVCVCECVCVPLTRGWLAMTPTWYLHRYMCVLVCVHVCVSECVSYQGLTRKDINLISAQVCVRVGVCVCVCECVCLWPGADSQWYQPDTCTGTCMFMRVCVCICIPITVRFNQCLQGRWNLAACGFSFLLSVLTVITDAIRLQGSASKAAIKNGRKQRRQAKQNRPF